MDALSNAHTRRGGTQPPYTGFTSDVIPEARCSQTGVSVRYIQETEKQWFVLRVSYGRIKKVQKVLDGQSVIYYIPKHYIIKLVRNRKKRLLVPLLPNFIFVYEREEKLKDWMDCHSSNNYLSYYYNHFITDAFGKNPPLTIPFPEMMNFIQATSVNDPHLMVVELDQCHYRSGDRIRIIDGKFRGVEGKVARVAGQQRVVVELTGLCLVATAYIPTAFIENINNLNHE